MEATCPLSISQEGCGLHQGRSLNQTGCGSMRIKTLASPTQASRGEATGSSELPQASLVTLQMVYSSAERS